MQPRIGFAYDVRGDGSDIVRGGWGIYNDFGYTNANILFPALNATGGSGAIFNVTNHRTASGIRTAACSESVSRCQQHRKPERSEPDRCCSTRTSRLRGSSSRTTRQASIGWSHQLDADTVVDVDYVHTRRKDLGWRPRLNQRNPGRPTGARKLADLGLSPANSALNIRSARSTYDGLNSGSAGG